MREYYVQRASAGLIPSEATSVSPMGVGYPDTPAIWSEEQVAGWRRITDAAHAAGGRMLFQLWHVGRVSDPLCLDGKLPVAPSAIAPKGHVSLVRSQSAYFTPRALALAEIPGIIADYARGAQNAKRAGFDGVEIHGADSYPLDQFLQDSTNTTSDEYGGPIETARGCCWRRSMRGVRAGSVYMWHRVPIRTTWAIATALARSATSPNRKRRIAFICARVALGPDCIGPALKRLHCQREIYEAASVGSARQR
jgi:hypothetical protein